jgi:hypothetical protein
MAEQVLRWPYLELLRAMEVVAVAVHGQPIPQRLPRKVGQVAVVVVVVFRILLMHMPL